MKYSLLLTVILLISACAPHQDALTQNESIQEATHTPGNEQPIESEELQFTITFEPSTPDAEAHFVLKLKNNSSLEREVALSRGAFHGVLHIKPAIGAPYEVYEESFLQLLLTSLWVERSHIMGPKTTFEWTLPFSRSRTQYGDSIWYEKMIGSTVYGELSFHLESSAESEPFQVRTLQTNQINIE